MPTDGSHAHAAAPATAHRSAALDVLRAVAVLLVMFRHLGPPPPSIPEPVRSVLKSLAGCGWMGVDLFFVISGFLIAGLLFSEHRARGEIGVGRFLIRRAFRIYPPFLLLLLVTVPVQYLWLGVPVRLADPNGAPPQLWPELCFMQSYFWSYWNHTWSLAVEEHFYIILPLILWLFCAIARPRREAAFAPLLLVFGAIVLAAYLWRCDTIARWPVETTPSAFQIIRHATPTHLRIDSLFIGVMLSYAYHARRDLFLRLGRVLWPLALPLAAIGIGACVVHPLQSGYVLTIGFPILAASFAGLIWVVVSLTPRGPAAATPPPRRPILAPLSLAAYLGRHSYSIYLWHMPAVKWGAILLTAALKPAEGSIIPYLARVLGMFIGSIALGLLAARLVEMPALRLRDRLFPSAAQPLGGAGDR